MARTFFILGLSLILLTPVHAVCSSEQDSPKLADESPVRVVGPVDVQSSRDLFDKITVSVAIIVLALTGWQILLLNRSINLSQTTLMVSERAYLQAFEMHLDDWLEGKELDDWINAGNKLEDWIAKAKTVKLLCKIKNAGNTPAKITEFIFTHDLFREPFPAVPDYTRVENFGNPDLVRDEVKPFQSDPFILNPSDLKHLFDREIHLYVWGRITYKDVFEKEHTTAFGRRFLPQQNNFLVVKEPSFNYTT